MTHVRWIIAACFVGTAAHAAGVTMTTLQPQTCETTDGKTCAGQNDPTWCYGPNGRCTVQENTRHQMEIYQQDKCRKEPDFMACMRAGGLENYK